MHICTEWSECHITNAILSYIFNVISIIFVTKYSNHPVYTDNGYYNTPVHAVTKQTKREIIKFE